MLKIIHHDVNFIHVITDNYFLKMDEKSIETIEFMYQRKQRLQWAYTRLILPGPANSLTTLKKKSPTPPNPMKCMFWFD